MAKKTVLVVGLGNMGLSHAQAYARIDGFKVVGVCERNIADRTLPEALAGARRFTDYAEALAALKPDVVSINTWADSHADYAVMAMEAGAHVFVEKPLAETVAEAERVVAAARRTGRKLVVGYILRHHPSWTKFIELARTLGTPLVFRMNLNQQSSGAAWATHKRLLQSLPPIVDCGVHYVDVWCQITRAARMTGCPLKWAVKVGWASSAAGSHHVVIELSAAKRPAEFGALELAKLASLSLSASQGSASAAPGMACGVEVARGAKSSPLASISARSKPTRRSKPWAAQAKTV